jgi:hypothetical protein
VKPSKLSLMDIRRDALARALDVEQTRAVVERLTAAGWLRAAPIVKTGGRPKERWAVNPQLFKPAESPESPESPALTDLSDLSDLSGTAEKPKRRQPR